MLWLPRFFGPALYWRPLACISGSISLEPSRRLTFTAIFAFVALMATFQTGLCRFRAEKNGLDGKGQPT